jgi:hypothetical protein
VVLVDFLRANTNIFEWSPSDMPGIPRRSPSTPLISYVTPEPCNNGCGALMKKGTVQSE